LEGCPESARNECRKKNAVGNMLAKVSHMLEKGVKKRGSAKEGSVG